MWRPFSLHIIVDNSFSADPDFVGGGTFVGGGGGGVGDEFG